MLSMLSPEDAGLLIIGGLVIGAACYLATDYIHKFSVWMNEE